MRTCNMESGKLKQAISEDLEALKTLDLNIIPSCEYYRSNLILFVRVFLKIYLTIIGVAFLSMANFMGFQKTLSTTFIAYAEVSALAFALTLFVFLFLYSPLNFYLLVKFHLQNRLQTGQLLVDKLQLGGRIAYGIFAFVLLPTAFFNPAFVLPVAFAALFISGIITSIIVEMETNRIGITVLFTLVKSYFDKPENKHVASIM